MGPLLEQVAEIEARLTARPLSSRAMVAGGPKLIAATDADVPAIVALMNLAYRSDGSDAGWTTETDYIQGDRTSEVMLRQDIAGNPAAKMLLGGSHRMKPCSAVYGLSRKMMLCGTWAHSALTRANRTGV